MPFIAEGLVHGMLGAIAGRRRLTWRFDTLWKRNFVDQVSFELLNQIKWTSGDLWTSVLMILFWSAPSPARSARASPWAAT